MKDKRNYAVDFWRFIFCITFVLVHTYLIYPMMYWHTAPWIVNGKPMFSGGLDVIIMFYLFTGYFLMHTFRKPKDGSKGKPGEEASKYLVARLKGFYPAFLICMVFGFVLTNIYNEFPVKDWGWIALDGLWEWLGGVPTGMGIGNNYYGLMADGRHMLMNGPLWFIPMIVLVGYLVYYALEKAEDFSLHILFPVGFMMAYGYFHVNGITPMWYNFDLPGISQAGIQAFFSIGMGCVYYDLVQKLQKKEYGVGKKVCLTIVNLLASGIVVYHMIFGLKLTYMTICGLCMVFVFLVLLNKDYLTKVLNCAIWKYPGKLALYIYMIHYPVIGMLHKVYPELSLHMVCLYTYLITILLSIVLMVVVDNVITPKLNKK